ncbi:VTT domain-containing protein [Rhizobium sp. PL01]|nr:VTT domain-containing protein [Rhizobium sp. PL01]MDW5317121.1 VTT domain-containing protein [Rhizobium sp. PL01]
MSYVSAFTSFVEMYPHLAYGLVLLLAFSESLPVLGAVVPGTAIIVGLAALVPSGVLKLSPLLVAALIGAMIGDGLSFWLGHRYHEQILTRWPFRRYPQLIERSEAFFKKYGGKSVFLARFTPGVRAFVPLVAGMLKMPVGRFYISNILSAFIWAPLHILPGVALGAYVHSAGEAAVRLAILVAVLCFLVWLTIRLVMLGIRRGVPILQSGLGEFRLWAGSHDSWLGNQIASLIDPGRRETALLAGLFLLLIASGWLFFGILEDVVTGDPLVSFDTAIFQLLQGLRTSWGDALMIGLTELGDTTVVVPVTIAVLLWLAWRRAWGTSAYFLAAVAGGSLFNTAIKVAVHRARPISELYDGWSNFSFPSGHSTTNAVLYGFIAFLIGRNLSLAGRAGVAFAAALLVTLIALSRVYLGAHWFSDAVGGLAFAITWLTVLGIAYQYHRSSEDRTNGILVVTIIALVTAGGLNITRHYQRDVHRYAVKDTAPMAEVVDWWNTGWQQLPARRVDITGESEEPFTLQWAGSLDKLRSTLNGAEWHMPPNSTLINSLQWFTPSPKLMSLPVVAHPERGRLPSMTLVRASGTEHGESRYVLRLWRANKRLSGTSQAELWLGSVVEETVTSVLGVAAYATENSDVNDPRNALSQALPAAKVVGRDTNTDHHNWDGKTLLAGDRDLTGR